MKEIRLSDWAKQNNMDYKTAWNQSRAGTLPIKTKTNVNGRIFAVVEDNQPIKEKKSFEFAIPLLAGKDTSLASTRRNVAATSNPTNQYYHINNGITPSFGFNRRGDAGNANFSISDAISLSWKAYFNFSVVRNVISAMEEFSVSKIYFQGGTAKSRNFFENLFDSLDIYSFQSQFFREYYCSGNVFIYRFDITAKDDDLNRLNKVYGSNAAKLQLPSKYTIINPCDVGAQSNIVFGTSTIFFKRLNGYEINRLKNPETPEEINFFNSLPKITQDQIKAGSGSIIVPLNPEKLYAVFYKAQPYHPMAIPMIYPVLKDIEWKAEMKGIDMAVSRTMNNYVLHVKMGYLDSEDNYMFDAKAAMAMQSLFESESVGKTLVTDFSTDVKFVIPTIGDFLDPVKYQIVNEDIKTGLNYVLTGTDSKFANQFISVQLFVQRLQEAREIFINQFLMPEIKRISGLMGFQSYPTPKFNDIDLKDDLEFNKIVTRLTELGILTPSELFDAMESGRIPTTEESLEHQETFRQQKDKGWYDPLIGSPYDAQKLAKLTASLAPKPAPGSPPANTGQPKGISAPTGRPTNINTKQSTKKVSITKGSEENIEEDSNIEQYSLLKIKSNLILIANLNKEVEQIMLKKYKLKKLDESQKSIASDISDLIVSNIDPADWSNKEIITKFIDNPIDSNTDKLTEINEISYRHQVSPFVASLLQISKK